MSCLFIDDISLIAAIKRDGTIDALMVCNFFCQHHNIRPDHWNNAVTDREQPIKDTSSPSSYYIVLEDSSSE
jgi:hypothetical protein